MGSERETVPVPHSALGREARSLKSLIIQNHGESVPFVRSSLLSGLMLVVHLLLLLRLHLLVTLTALLRG